MKKKYLITGIIILMMGTMFSGCYIRTYPQRPEPRYYEHGYYKHYEHHRHHGYRY